MKILLNKEPIIKPKRYQITSSESSDEKLTNATINKKMPPRPPTIIVKNTLCDKFNIAKAVRTQETVKPLSSSSSHC